MKFFSTLAASFLGLAAVSFAAPFADPDAAEAYELIQREAGKAGVEVVVRTAETGDVSIGLTPRGDDDEDFSGEIVEKPNGTLVFYDEAGKNTPLTSWLTWPNEVKMPQSFSQSAALDL
ncbi:hypothetical protein JX266_013029 [Neoarthrinium moseri]|nr:hypothetical protein JX266_013029 [Neoarthrinium moseri]